MDFRHLLPSSFFASCQTSAVGHWMATSQWSFAIVETIHIMGLAVLLGTLLIVDLRLLNLGMRRQAVADLASALGPWTRAGLAVMFSTGILLFLSEAVRLSRSGPFFYKMVLLLLALVFHFTIRRKATGEGPAKSAGLRRVAGSLSLICWLGVAFAGRGIAFLGKAR